MSPGASTKGRGEVRRRGWKGCARMCMWARMRARATGVLTGPGVRAPGIGGIGTSESLREMLQTELRPSAKAVSALDHLLSSQSLSVAVSCLRKALSLAWGCQFG